MRCPRCHRAFPPEATACPEHRAALCGPLAQHLRRGPMPIAQAAKIVERLCIQLAPLHGSGKLHGRITLENVFFRHVADQLEVFVIEANEGAAPQAPHYLPQERLRGEAEDPRSDVHALGVLLHHMISGAPPWDASSPAAIAKLKQETETPSLLGFALQDVPEELDALLRSTLDRSPSARPRSVRELREQLENIALGSTLTGERLSAFAGAPNPPASVPPQVALDEETIEAAPPRFEISDVISLNPTEMDLTDRARSAREAKVIVPEVTVEHPTDLFIDPYADTLVRKRSDLELAEEEHDTYIPQGPRDPGLQAQAQPSPPPAPSQVQRRTPTIVTAPRAPAARRIPTLLVIGILLLAAALTSFVVIVMR